MTARPERLHPSVSVAEHVDDLDALWNRFEIFEAIHHTQRICNPMTEREFGRVLDLLAPESGGRWLDIACGPGELLIQAVERGAGDTHGVDLSPWMLHRAAAEGVDRLGVDRAPRWTLADAARLDADPHDVVVCLGAEWIWHGRRGTLRAVRDRVRPNGLVAFGGPRLNFGADPETITEEFGVLDTVDDVEQDLADLGLVLLERIDPGEAGWLAYLDRGSRDVGAWAERHPGPRADEWVAAQQEWIDSFERDRAVVGWSVWIARHES